ncbi:hypothetical protein GPB2148_3403 [marine gamma proteobacterium HTCC2148]|nr:hypothetical protein GPB2148_3403 [marine gamma proteobacterium HTCC2148]
MLTEGRAHRGARVGLTSRHLQLDISFDFLSHDFSPGFKRCFGLRLLQLPYQGDRGRH